MNFADLDEKMQRFNFRTKQEAVQILHTLRSIGYSPEQFEEYMMETLARRMGSIPTARRKDHKRTPFERELRKKMLARTRFGRIKKAR